jgi:thiosulfate/3-mercaptopyruvate sulfurtransferase
VDNFDPLVDTEWLQDHLEDPDVRVVDIRGYVKKTDLGGGRQGAEYLPAREEYDEAHVPGAVFVDWTRDITDPDNPVPAQVAPPDRFAGLMGSWASATTPTSSSTTTPAASSRPACGGR